MISTVYSGSVNMKLATRLSFLALLFGICQAQAGPSCPSNVGTQCYPGGHCAGYFASYYAGPTCVEGYCRCQGIPYYDDCTCLPHVSSCLIEKDGYSVGIPTTDGVPEETYSCVANDSYNCEYDVHVIGNYESSNGQHGFNKERQAGDTYVTLSAVGQSSRPLILALVSYEPVNWKLSASGVVIEKVILGGYYESTVNYSPSKVETLSSDILSSGYGTDTGGGHTAENLLYLTERFGPIASFSGSYRADGWTINIVRSSGCNPTPPPPPAESDDDGAGVVQSSLVVTALFALMGSLAVFKF